MPHKMAAAAMKQTAKALNEAAENQAEQLAEAAKMMAKALAAGGKILICGNGGSAAEAQHFAAELVGRFLMERPGLPAVALTTDTSILTAVGNDYGFETIFERQVMALARPGDVVWGLSTSGRSPNVLKAFQAAAEAGAKTVFMCGAEAPAGLKLDFCLTAPSGHTPAIQELHLAYGHLICQLIDHFLFDALDQLGDLNA